MKKNILNIVLVGSMISLVGCTDLEVDEKDSLVIESSGDFKGVDAANTLNAAYNDLAQNTQENLYALSVATTDELFIPTRGTDWGDNGVWRDLAKHTWTPAHQFNLNTWNFLNGNVYRTNQILHPNTTKNVQQEAEARFIRAYNMFWILDLYRQIPFREADEGPTVNPKVLTPQESFDLILDDLTKALPALPSVPANSIAQQNRASQASARFLLAKLYLNKHIYLGGEVKSADMDLVIALIDAISAEGYALQEGFFNIFAPSADSETILYSSNVEYANRIWGSLHYNQGRDTQWQNGGWNGFATTAEFFEKFEGPSDSNPEGGPQEERRGYVPNDGLGFGFLVGVQYGPDGNPIKARSGQPLNFTKSVPTLTGNPDYTGIRLLKYQPNVMGETFGRHLILMRYADAVLMKAEALLRKGSADEALTLVNQLRDIRDASALAAPLSLDMLLDERGRELYIEGWRRNDMVRFGKFNSNFGFVENTDPSRNVFPIPELALTSNPNLSPNPGY